MLKGRGWGGGDRVVKGLNDMGGEKLNLWYTAVHTEVKTKLHT